MGPSEGWEEVEDEGWAGCPVKDEKEVAIVEEVAVWVSASLPGLAKGTGIGSDEETMGGREELRKAEAVPDDMKAAFIVLNGGGDLFTSESLIGGVRLREGDRDLVP